MMTKGTAAIVDTTKNDRSKHSKYAHVRFNIADSLMRYAETLGYGDLHIKVDEKTGLKAIIAVNNLTRGPAIGGCRFTTYHSISDAMEDALRLGYMMSYKAAINNLPHGGAKAVILKPKVIKDYDAFFEKFGEFVHELGGRYITAMDSGTSPREMDLIAKHTPYVTCTSELGGNSDPSPLTALGVRRGIEAALKFKMNQDSLDGIHVAIQGAGHVGYYLAKELHALGATLTMTDINESSLQRCVDEFGVKKCLPNEIYSLDADVFAPCAMGAVLNLRTIKELKVSIVAGSANNQLSHSHYGTLMHERGILYAPDFLINAGGLIHVAVLYDRGNLERSVEQIKDIYNTVYAIYELSAQENRATNQIAERIARDRLR